MNPPKHIAIIGGAMATAMSAASDFVGDEAAERELREHLGATAAPQAVTAVQAKGA